MQITKFTYTDREVWTWTGSGWHGSGRSRMVVNPNIEIWTDEKTGLVDACSTLGDEPLEYGPWVDV